MKNLPSLILCGLALLWLPIAAIAMPQKINYQGYLTNPAGAALNGSYSMVFALCDAANGGACPWSETQTVVVTKGVFNVTLGTLAPIGLDFSAPYYLDIQIGGEAMNARQPLTAVGYAFRAQQADGVVAGSIANGNLAAGSFGNITGVGALDTLTVNGNTLLAHTSGTVGIGSNVSTPRAQLEVGGTEGLLVTGTYNTGTAQSLGAGARLHWYPKKGAFRAGVAETTWWDDAHIGMASVAMGYWPRASGVGSTAIGPFNYATGDYSLALGYGSSASGNYSIAIGTGSPAIASGFGSIAIGTGADTNGRASAVVIGDGTIAQHAYATNDNQITMRFIGGKGGSCGDDNIMNDGGPGTCKAYRFLTYYPDTTYGVYMNGGSSGWVNYSSRDLKENFRPLDGEELLGKIRTMSITEWNYKGTPENRYIGPVAEEFREAFHLNGEDQTGINTISIDGVNLAGVQALEKRTSAMKADAEQRNAALQAQIDTLKAELAQLKALLAAKQP